MKRPTFLTLDEALALHSDHPFLDGNKRAGLMAALVFLGLNGLELEADANALTELVLGIAAGNVSKAETTVFIERHSRARRA